MVNAKTVLAKFKTARKGRGQWSKIDKDHVAYVRDSENGEWKFTVKALEPPLFRLEMKSPGGPSAPPKGEYQFGTKTYRNPEEAKTEANYWIGDVEKGGGIKPTGWKKI